MSLLPLELEQKIFLIALHDNWERFIPLILVSRRIYHWLLPQIYNVVVFHPSKPKSRNLRLPSHSLIINGNHVRHLLLSNVESPHVTGLYHSTAHCISLCPNLRSIALILEEERYDIPLIGQLVSLPHLTHLSFDLAAFQDGLNNADRGLAHPSKFLTVTHVDVMFDWIRQDLEDIDTLFPALTHLALMGDGPTEISLIVPWILKLERWKGQLEVVVWYMHSNLGDRGVGGDQGREGESESGWKVVPTSELVQIKDPRVVVLCRGWNMGTIVGDWYENSVGGLGIWAMAGAVVKGRLGKALKS